ncbi:rubredoxin [Cupriavidus gilardii]|uniref:rubredoxin n=1 Tax=Cupriavidus gilardii TaxID=82541 RepID=UPI003B8A70EC
MACLGCGYLYDEADGLPGHGLAAGTRWDDIPDDWWCPDCGTPKALFQMVELPYAEGVQAGPTAPQARPAEPATRRLPSRPPENYVLRDSERGFHQDDWWITGRPPMSWWCRRANSWCTPPSPKAIGMPPTRARFTPRSTAPSSACLVAAPIPMRAPAFWWSSTE